MSSCSGVSRVLVVGGGLTAAVTSSLLTEKLAQGSVNVWDKARGAGGRMTTSRSPGNPQCKVDLGAQYVSATPANQCKHQDVYSDLLDAGVLVALDTQGIQGFRKGEPGTLHYSTPQGMSSIVKHFFNRSGLAVDFNRRIVDVSSSGAGWSVTTDKEIKGDFDAVVITMPVPQVLELGGDIASLIQSDQSVLNKLKGVEYSARFALGLFFDESVDLGVNWTSNYVNHNIFRFVAVDNLKRGDKEGPTSVIAHTSVPFGIKHIERTPDSMKDELVAELMKLFPAWPQPRHIKCLKWRYSQVSRSYAGSPDVLVLKEDPLLILAGDGFAASSNFDGCVDSATRAAALVLNKLA